MSDQRDNFYNLLDLDPKVLDWTTIESVIRSKRGKWAKDKSQSPSPKRKRDADKNLRLLPEIERVMKDDALRKQEASQAIKLIKESRKRQVDNLRRDLSTLTAKGYILELEIAKLVKEYGSQGILEAEIRAEIAVEVRKEQRSQREHRAKSLDTSVRKSIEAELGTLGVSDLYKFLGASRQSQSSTLLNKADEIDSEVRKYAKKTPEVSAKQVLVGHCKVIFVSNEMRESYDHSMAEQGLDEVTKQINFIATDTIDPLTYQKLLKVGMECGSAKDDVELHIREIAKKRGKGIEIASSHNGTVDPQCGHCQALNQAGDTNCRKCGQPLIVTCPMPQCNARIPSTNPNCTKCGFPVGDLPEISRLLAEAKSLLSSGNAEGARAVVAKMQRDLLSKHSSYPPVESLLDQASRSAKSQADLQSDLQNLVREQRMEKADAILTGAYAGQTLRPQLAKLKLEIDEALARAKSDYNAAIRAEENGKYDEAFACCTSALGVVQDYTPATKLLSKYPPEPPGSLTATTDKIVSLSWLASPSKGVLDYIVVRKEGATPSSSTDGDVIGNTSANRFDDNKTEPGANYYYGIFTVRAGIYSPGRNTGPCMCVDDVTTLTAKPGDGIVNLSWTMPTRAVGVEVWRVDNGHPAKRGVGLKIKNVRQSGVADTALSNGRSYGYLVSAIFRKNDGTFVASRGVAKLACPSTPPSPLEGISAQRKGSKVLLTWRPPMHGVVEIYRFDTAPKVNVGDEHDIDRLSSLGAKIANTSDRSAEDDLRGETLAYYLPITVSGTVGVVGEGCCITAVDDVEDLKVTARGASLLMKWNWSGKTKLCKIQIRTDRFPQGTDDPRAFQDEVLLSVYEAKGGYYTTISDDATALYVSVHAGVAAGDKTAFAAGSSHGARKQISLGGNVKGSCELKYEISRPNGWFDSQKVHRVIIYGGNHEVTLPSLSVVAKARTIPLKVGGGRIIHTFPKGQTVKPGDVLELSFSAGNVLKGEVALLFTTDTSDAEWLTLRPKKPRMEL